MNEQSPSDNVIKFIPKEERLDAIEDDMVLEHFLAELRHPGAAGHIAERILEYAGTKPYEDMSEERIAWRERMIKIRFSIGYSDRDWDNLVDSNHEDYDAGFAAIEKALRVTRGDENFEEARKALLVLLDLRVAAINRGLENPSEWIALAQKLISV